MKTFFLSILALGLLGGFGVNLAQAQERGGTSGVSGDLGKPGTLSDFGILNVLITRFHTVDVGALAREMQEDGETERSFVAVFSVEGALLYNHEMQGHDKGLEISGKNAGKQVLPYTVSVSADGRTFVSVAAFAWKNMNTAHAAELPSADAYRDRNNNYGKSSFWSYVDNIQLLVYEYDDQMAIDGMTSQRVKVVSGDIKMDILGSSSPGTFLALTMGAEVGMSDHAFSHNGEDLNVGQWDPYGEARYGLEFNKTFSKWRVNSQVNFYHQGTLSSSQDPVLEAAYEGEYSDYENALVNYEEQKRQYEVENLGGAEMSQESYENLTGITTPKRPEEPGYEPFKRYQYVMVPSLNISRRFERKDGRPYRLGVSVFGSVPFQDETSGIREVDFTQRNRSRFGAKFFINF